MGKAREAWRQGGLMGFARWVLVKRVGKWLFRGCDSFLASQSLVGDAVLLDRSHFPWIERIESDWKAVRDELEPLLERRKHLPPLHEIQPDQAKVSHGEDWKTFMLMGYGYRSGFARSLCPRTVGLLEGVPGVSTAWFSILAPGTHIPRHSGVTKAMIRSHLALCVPKQAERCRMRVGSETVRWEEGRCVLFDDSSKHEVWNDTDEERVVLVFDFERPMRWPGRAVSAVLQAVLRQSPFVRTARRNQLAWERRWNAATEGP